MATGGDYGEFAFKRFLRHRWVDDSIEIEVEWEKGEPSWEDEESLHRDAPDALFEYWEEQGGRPENPNDAEMYDIFAIRKHSKDRRNLLVEWVGYGPKDATWLSRSVVQQTAPDVVKEYFAALPKKRRRARR